MIKINNEKVKKIEIEILVNVSEFCRKNNITYFLACGTLLGCIRHKGFIPWDDDVDIMMPRPDYDKFISIYRDNKYSLLKPSEGRYSYLKVYDNNTIKFEYDLDYKKYYPIGIDIDIFPLDGIINNKIIINVKYKIICLLEIFLRLSNQPIFYRRNPLKAINRIIPRIIGSKNLVKLIENIAKLNKYDECNYVIRWRQSSNGFTGAIKKEAYEKSYAVFEGKEFCIPKGYDVWLSNFYGDYMILPPPEKQKVHNNLYYEKDI